MKEILKRSINSIDIWDTFLNETSLARFLCALNIPYENFQFVTK